MTHNLALSLIHDVTVLSLPIAQIDPGDAIDRLSTGNSQTILAVLCVGMAIVIAAMARYIALIIKARIEELKLAMTTVAESNAQTAQTVSEMTRTVEMLTKQGGGS